ncbi:hypothetical protein V8C35DRAFT_319015 [Trichoderma chlorosporum]
MAALYTLEPDDPIDSEPENLGDFISDSESDLNGEYSDSVSELSDPVSGFSDTEEDEHDYVPNLFECAIVTHDGNVAGDICSPTSCSRSFESRAEVVKHLRSCPATQAFLLWFGQNLPAKKC